MGNDDGLSQFDLIVLFVVVGDFDSIVNILEDEGHSIVVIAVINAVFFAVFLEVDFIN